MEHMTELPRLAEADGVFFLTLAKGDRTSIATTIQRLIDMIDTMDGDPDSEITLEDNEDAGDFEPEESDCDLAGAYTDVDDPGYYDAPGFIWGGGEGGREAGI